MGNTASDSYMYSSVSDIPEGTSPPSIGELSKKIKEVSLYAIQKFDPVELKTCQGCMKYSQNIKGAETILADLSSYQPDQQSFAEKTYQFKLTGAPDIWVSSTKNSDHTISYWFQYPVLPFHIQSAFLSSMNIPITTSNLHQISDRYRAVYTQLLHMNKNEVAKCEQIEPLYVDLAIKSLLSRGYKYHKKHVEVY